MGECNLTGHSGGSGSAGVWQRLAVFAPQLPSKFTTEGIKIASLDDISGFDEFRIVVSGAFSYKSSSTSKVAGFDIGVGDSGAGEIFLARAPTTDTTGAICALRASTATIGSFHMDGFRHFKLADIADHTWVRNPTNVWFKPNGSHLMVTGADFKILIYGMKLI